MYPWHKKAPEERIRELEAVIKTALIDLCSAVAEANGGTTRLDFLAPKVARLRAAVQGSAS